MKEYPVLGIVGMAGSGKSVLSQKFMEKGWNSVYFGGITLDELNRRKLEPNQANEKLIREELRNELGPEAYAKLLLPSILDLSKVSPLVLDGLYSWPEFKFLKNNLSARLQILAIVADSATRYQRLSVRNQRSLTEVEAIKRDYSEIEKLEKGGPIAIADFYIYNNGTKEELESQFNHLYDTYFNLNW